MVTNILYSVSIHPLQCCDSAGNPIDYGNICVFRGERTTYETAAARCEAYSNWVEVSTDVWERSSDYSLCSWDTVPPNGYCGTDNDYSQGSWSVHTSPGIRFSWTSDPCSMSAQIDQDGNVSA